jgi:hypothetical protein
MHIIESCTPMFTAVLFIVAKYKIILGAMNKEKWYIYTPWSITQP